MMNLLRNLLLSVNNLLGCVDLLWNNLVDDWYLLVDYFDGLLLWWLSNWDILHLLDLLGWWLLNVLLDNLLDMLLRWWLIMLLWWRLIMLLLNN